MPDDWQGTIGAHDAEGPASTAPRRCSAGARRCRSRASVETNIDRLVDAGSPAMPPLHIQRRRDDHSVELLRPHAPSGGARWSRRQALQADEIRQLSIVAIAEPRPGGSGCGSRPIRLRAGQPERRGAATSAHHVAPLSCLTRNRGNQYRVRRAPASPSGCGRSSSAPMIFRGQSAMLATKTAAAQILGDGLRDEARRAGRTLCRSRSSPSRS